MPPTRRPGLRGTRLGVVGVAVPVVWWSFANLIPKVVGISALSFSFWRLCLGTVVMLGVVAVARRRIGWAMIRAAAPGGVVFALNLLLFFAAIKQTKIADVLVIGALQPAITLILAGPMFGERAARRDLVLAGISMLGVVVFVIGASGAPEWSLEGDLLAVGSLLLFTTYFLLTKHVRERVPPVEYMTTVTVVATVVITIVVLVTRETLSGLDGTGWWWLLLFVMAAQLGHLVMAWAFSHVDVSLASLVLLGETPIGALAALVFLGESLSLVEVVGGVMVLAGVGGVVRAATSRPRRPELSEVVPT